MSKESPINLRANSFANFDDAMDLCDLLNRETGAEYTVMSDNHLGFTASKCRSSARNQDPKNAETDNEKENAAYRQSLRGFIEHYAEFILGLFLMISPYQVLALVFSLLDIKEIPGWFSVSGCGETFRYIGIFLFLYSLRFVYSYTATRICFDNDGVILKKGIIAQNQVQIRFGDIKTIGVKQSVVDRLLGIGSIQLDSAGTGANDDVDIVFDNLIKPVQMRHRIQTLIELHTKQSRMNR